MKQTDLPILFCLGDSIALHYYPHLARFLEGTASVEVRQGYLEALEDINHPRGSNCGDSSMVFAFLETLLKRPGFQPHCVVFNCGLHDIKTDPTSGMRQVDIDDYSQNLEKIVQLLHASHTRPLWITTTPVDDAQHHRYCPEVSRFQRDVDAYNERARQVMAKAQVPCIDLHRFTLRLKGELYMDHVHYTDAVRELQAAYLAGQIERLLPPC